NILSGVLSGSQEYGSDNICSVSIESANASSHCASNQILADIQLDNAIDIALENALNNGGRNNSFGDDTLATTLNPVDCSRFLVCAVVTGNRNDLHIRESAIVCHNRESVLDTLGDHVHTHSIASR